MGKRGMQLHVLCPVKACSAADNLHGDSTVQNSVETT